MSQSRGLSREIRHGAFKGRRRFETVDELPDEYRQLLLKFLAVQADTELGSIEQYLPWLVRAPRAEDRWIVARQQADEVRHGLEMLRLLRLFGPEGEALERDVLRRRLGEHFLPAFNIPLETWPDVLAHACLMDRVGEYQLRSMADCSFAPLARAIGPIVQEERMHPGYGTRGLARMARGEDPHGTPADAQAAIDRWWPRALATFGKPRSRTAERMVYFGMRDALPDALRAQYIAEVGAILTQIGLRVPPVPAEYQPA